MKVLAVGEGGVAVAMGELHLWSYEIVAAEAEVGHDGGISRQDVEKANAPLTLYLEPKQVGWETLVS